MYSSCVNATTTTQTHTLVVSTLSLHHTLISHRRTRAKQRKMSWQTYVDEHLMCDLGNGDLLTAAAIIGHDGSVWAQSENFPQVLEFVSSATVLILYQLCSFLDVY